MTDDVEAKGRALARSALNLTSSGPDLQAMIDALSELLQKQSNSDREFSYCGETQDIDNAWLYRSAGYNFDVFEVVERSKGQRGASRKPKRLGTVTIWLRLCEAACDVPEVDWPWKDQACLIVGWHNREGNREDYWNAWDIDPTAETIDHIRHIGHGLWSWRGTEGEELIDYSFFFALPVFALNSEKDLMHYAIKPLIMLFQYQSPAEALPEALIDVPVLKVPRCKN